MYTCTLTLVDVDVLHLTYRGCKACNARVTDPTLTTCPRCSRGAVSHFFELKMAATLGVQCVDLVAFDRVAAAAMGCDATAFMGALKVAPGIAALVRDALVGTEFQATLKQQQGGGGGGGAQQQQWRARAAVQKLLFLDFPQVSVLEHVIGLPRVALASTASSQSSSSHEASHDATDPWHDPSQGNDGNDGNDDRDCHPPAGAAGAPTVSVAPPPPRWQVVQVGSNAASWDPPMSSSSSSSSSSSRSSSKRSSGSSSNGSSSRCGGGGSSSSSSSSSSSNSSNNSSNNSSKRRRG